MENLLYIPHVRGSQHLSQELIVGFNGKNVSGSFLQGFLLAIRKASIAGFDKVMVKGGVGALWRADGHNGEVKVFNGMGGDRGGYGILLPIFIGLTYKSSCSNEANRHNSNPNDLG